MKNMRRWVVGAVLLGIANAVLLFGAIVNGYLDFTGISAPSNPASGNARLYYNSGSSLLGCLTSSGGNCFPSGFSNPMTTLGDIIVGGASGAPNRLGVGTNGYVLTANSGATYGLNWAAASGTAGMVQLSQTILGSPAGSITFSSISGSYSNLQIEFLGADTASAASESINMQINSDSTSGHYAYQYVLGAQGSVSSGNNSGTSLFVANITAATSFANAGSMMSVRIPGYASTTFTKAIYSSSAVPNQTSFTSTSTYQNLQIAGFWNSTSAITQIVLTPNVGNFATGTIATLYGLL